VAATPAVDLAPPAATPADARAAPPPLGASPAHLRGASPLSPFFTRSAGLVGAPPASNRPPSTSATAGSPRGLRQPPRRHVDASPLVHDVSSLAGRREPPRSGL